MAGVSFEGVSKIFPGQATAVRDLNLDVRDGELLAVVGPSGAGKTTLLRLIAGLEKTSAGQIRIDGRPVNEVPPHQRNVAFVFQQPALFPHLNVRENLAFGLRLRQPLVARLAGKLLRRRGLSQWNAKNDAQVAWASTMLGLDGLLNRLPHELSGGEQQRVALGRALVERPQVFLLDEPLAHLDTTLKLNLRQELKQLHAALAATMIYVTHDYREALAIGDRVAVLDRGQMRQIGSPQEVYDQPADEFVARFVGHRPINLFRGNLGAGNFEAACDNWLFRGRDWSVTVDNQACQGLQQCFGQPLVLGLRPEHLHLSVPVGGGLSVVAGFEARVVAVEREGDRIAVGLALPEAAETVWAESSATGFAHVGQAGEPVKVWLDMRHALWFDAQTGRNLAGPQGLVAE